MKYYVIMFGISLLLTQIVEVLVLVIRKECSKKNLLLLLLINVLTNPAAVYFSMLGGHKLWVQLLIEIVVIRVEAFVYCCFAKEKGWEIKEPIKLAIWANAISWLLGVLIQ